MTVLEALGSDPQTHHKLLKLSRSAKIMTGLVLRDTNLISVIKSLVQFTETFKCSHDNSFNEARIRRYLKKLGVFPILAECGLGQLPALRPCDKTYAPVLGGCRAL